MAQTKRIASQTFRVPHLGGLTDFYAGILGMEQVRDEPEMCSFRVSPESAELVFRSADVAPHESQPNDFYWKIGITVRDLDVAVEHLRSHGLQVQAPTQFRDIGYLTKITDPCGFSIELLQQGFEGNEKSLAPGNPIAMQSIVAHITLRVTNLAASKRFFEETLGMRLMSVQPVEPYEFCLYFYAWSDEVLPDSDLASVDNREWLWARPYTLIELQHLQVDDAVVRKSARASAGFDGFSYRDHRAEKEILVSIQDLAGVS